jgi:hypothetical protein
MASEGRYSPTQVRERIVGNNWTSGANVVGVGGRGKIATSADGINWTFRTTGTKDNVNNVHYGGNQFVAVGNNGLIMTSKTGIYWTRRSSGVTAALQGIVWSENFQRWVVTGSNNTILYSSDGINWSQATSPAQASANISDVAYGNMTWIAVTSEGTPTLNILRSEDGITWTGQLRTISGPPYNNVIGVAYSPSLNQFAIAGSQFGIDYTTSPYSTWVNGGSVSTHWCRWIGWVPGTSNRWVVAQYANYWAYSNSNSSTTFTTSTARVSDNSNFGRFAWIPRLNLMFAGQDSGAYYYSTDGTSWTLGANLGLGAFAGPNN